MSSINSIPSDKLLRLIGLAHSPVLIGLRGQDEHVADAADGGAVLGTYRQTIHLSSVRFAMIDDGLGFQLVPCAASLQDFQDRQLSEITRGEGGVDWRLESTRWLGQ